MAGYAAVVLNHLEPEQCGRNFTSKEEADTWLVTVAEEYVNMGISLEHYDFVAIHERAYDALLAVVEQHLHIRRAAAIASL